MIVLSVTLQVVPGRLEEFLAVIRENAERSVADEPGCLSFEVAQDLVDDHHFLLHELYEDEAAVQAHRTTPHFAAWRRAVDRCVVPGSQVNTLATRLVHHAAGSELSGHA